MKNLLMKHGSKKPHIFISGHSLGGALALLASVDIKETLKPSNKITLYTYGQPRVGNQAWATYVYSLFPNNYIRVTHADDAVPHMPPRLVGFKHAGNEVWFKNAANDE
jgi:predicted lipase